MSGSRSRTDHSRPAMTDRPLTPWERDQLRDACFADPDLTPADLAARWGCDPAAVAEAVGWR